MLYVAKVHQEGDQWLAEFPDAPGCQTFADSYEELRADAKEALEGWLEAHLERGAAPPRPKPRAARGLVVDVEPGLAIALEVRWARQDAGLSQAELAERAGVSQQQIAKLESPEGNPSVATIAKIARALGLRPVVELARGVVPVGLAKKRRLA
jgi:predicted RNase H-like HicB family nuclease/DNA-binding XRE family transcriptional regulator